MPAGAADARGGRWVRGPGRAVFDAPRRSSAHSALIAEDLGVITPAVRRLRDGLGLPGMVVLQFAFDPATRTARTAPRTTAPGRSLYTGTHDNDTLRGWCRVAAGPERLAEVRAAGVGTREPWWDLVEVGWRSRARLFMLQAQDVLGLGSEARMNMPGRAGGQWRWRMATAR